MEKIQSEIKLFCEKHKLETTIEIRMMDLSSEIGELSKEIIKSTNYGKEKFKITENTEKEIGDVLFSLITIANDLDINLESALNKVITKYSNRLNKGNTIGSESELL
jgi:NTP pyrophosphatase (non-canonical NTP hydrolase)